MKKIQLFALCFSCTLLGLGVGLTVNMLTLYDAHTSALYDKSQDYQLLSKASPELTDQLSQSLKAVTLPYHLCRTRSLHQMMQKAGLGHTSVDGLLQSNYALYQLETEQLQQEFCAGKEFRWF